MGIWGYFGDLETRGHGDKGTWGREKDLWARGHRDVGTEGSGDVGTRTRGNTGTRGDGNLGMRMWGDVNTGARGMWGREDAVGTRGTGMEDAGLTVPAADLRHPRHSHRAPGSPPTPGGRDVPYRHSPARHSPHRSWNGSPPRPVPQRWPRSSKCSPGRASFRGNRGTRCGCRGGGKVPGADAGLLGTEQQEAGRGKEAHPKSAEKDPAP